MSSSATLFVFYPVDGFTRIFDVLCPTRSLTLWLAPVYPVYSAKGNKRINSPANLGMLADAVAPPCIGPWHRVGSHVGRV